MTVTARSMPSKAKTVASRASFRTASGLNLGPCKLHVDLVKVMVARVSLVCFDSCALLAVFAPAAFVPARVSVAVAGSVADVA